MALIEPVDMGATIKAAKADLRRLIGASLKSLSQETIRVQSLGVHSTLFALPEYQKAKSLSIFLSMPTGEILTEPIVKHAFDHGKSVFIPYIYKDQIGNESQSVMDMVQLYSIEDFQQLAPDKWGIPSLNKASLSGRQRCLGNHEVGNQGAELDLVIMPGVAFDRNLQRIGHGKGYYDLFLKRYSEHTGSKTRVLPSLIALALQEQLLPEGQTVPTEVSDWPMDTLISGDGLILR